MEIHGGKPPERSEVVELGKVSNNGKLAQDGQAGIADRIDLSGEARGIPEIVAAVKALPEIRAEKVAEIRKSIESGSYAVDPEKIAKRMIDEIL